jgi:glycosyltransferase involved in cell wall biosynthesis
LLINAFGLIADQCPDWNIYIYGDGPEKEKLLLLINQKKLTERIIIKDPVSTIYEEYQQSEFYVLSSRYEGFPLVLNETMSCGIPCIAFRCKYGPEDIIVDGGNGLLVEKENIKELAKKILWMIEHIDERFRMGKTARETALRYKKSEIMRLWTDMFEKIGKAKTQSVL